MPTMGNGKPKLVSRARLWLRSEKAFGLDSLPYRNQTQSEAGPYEIERPTPAQAPRPLPAPVKSGSPVNKPDPIAARQGLMPPPAVAPIDAPVLPVEERRIRLAALDQNEVSGCTKCRLCQTRTRTVFGEGDPGAKIFFIGEGPGENEDLSGRPFVGRAGQLLDKMINAMGLKREQVFIANIVKCRPPNNREPAPDEVATCTPYLERQLEIIRPQVIVTLGRPAASHMLQTKVAMGKIRGQWQSWRGIKLMPTFHPAYVLRQYTEETRAAVWSDLKKVLVELGMPVSSRGS
ncbi:MAG TPA: uracil-DNA glycosylase family protein [Tepidisphaeraceae bacterium]|jgi:DNA polymerase|nr:uracil-DNA glycosylase family protein [Tepidisphaeraceae bacterium]